MLTALVPTPGLQDLLPKLAEHWRANLDADAAWIAFSDATTPLLQAGAALRGRPPHLVARACRASASLFDGIIDDAETVRSIATRTWSLSDPFRAALAWHNAHPPHVDLADDRDFTFSAALLVQAAWMDRACDSPSARDRLEREKREALAEFAAGAGHEINNPVATIVGRAQMLLADEADEERRQQLLTIGAQALRIRDMIGDLMLFGRPPPPQLAPHDLAEIVQAEAPKLREAATARGTALLIEAAAPVPVLVDRVQVCVVLHALARNSLEALRTGGALRISVRTGVEGGRVVGILAVTDDGPGLSETDRRHLFDPFYSGRQAGRGLGFGLPKCWRIVDSHSGRIDVASRSGETTVTVVWPHD